MASQFADLNASRVSISPDSVRRLKKFDDMYGLGFQMLSDPGGEIARIFGVKRFWKIPPVRATFVVGEDERVLRVICNELSMAAHAELALETLQAHASPPSKELQ